MNDIVATLSISNMEMPNNINPPSLGSGSSNIVLPSTEAHAAVFVDKGACSLSEQGPILYDSVDFDSESDDRAGLGYITAENISDVSVENLVEPKEEVQDQKDDKSHVRHSQTSGQRVCKLKKGKKKSNAHTKKDKGYIVIGGVHVYNDDSSPSEEGDGMMLSDDIEYSSDGVSKVLFAGKESLISDLSESSENSESECMGLSSDIDDEMVKDYLDGIGCSPSELRNNSAWLTKRDFLQNVSSHSEEESSESESSTDDSSDESCDDLDTFDASTGMGSKMASYAKSQRRTSANSVHSADEGCSQSLDVDANKSSAKKHTARGKNAKKKSTTYNYGTPSSLESFLFTKDLRDLSNRKSSKSSEVHQMLHMTKTSMHKKSSGDKRKQRKEMIGSKRRERALKRGVDLDVINQNLEKMVINSADMLICEPMHSRDCSQVKKLAAIYHLKSGVQGSGKKKIITLRRTTHTSMPSANGKQRLLQLLGTDDFMEDMPLGQSNSRRKGSGETARTERKARKAKRVSYMAYLKAESQIYTGKDPKQDNVIFVKSVAKKDVYANSKKKATPHSGKGIRAVGYANQPMSFVSSGAMETDNNMVKTSASKDSTADSNVSSVKQIELKIALKSKSESAKMGSFEAHTKGFGSRIMSKMGFVEGSGLGKDSQGIVRPIEAIKRPKSLGLGL